MAEGKVSESWNHTSQLLALIANVNRDPKKTRAFKPADFHPFMKKRGWKLNAKDIGILKNVFVREKGKP
jgi:hypothetical protein